MLDPCLNFISSNESKNTEVNSVFINHSLFPVYRYSLVTHIKDYCGNFDFARGVLQHFGRVEKGFN